MEKDTNAIQVVLRLVGDDINHLERVVAARRGSRPPGARHLSRLEVIRQLIREAAEPGAMTDDPCTR